MLKGNGNLNISNESVMDWMINEEPNLVKKIYEHFFPGSIELSFDSKENAHRLQMVSDKIIMDLDSIYQSLSRHEKLILYVMNNGFGWIVYENIKSTVNILSHVFKVEFDDLMNAVSSLLDKFLIFKFERLKRYNLLFAPPVILANISEQINGESFFSADEQPDMEDIRENHSPYQYISLIAGLISYVITYSPRSSESNEIHKIDFVKMIDFFADFASKDVIEKIIKKLSRFGFFEKLNNRIIVNKNILDRILGLSIDEQLFIIFLYEFMDKFDFKKSYFMTLKILARQERIISLRELFFYYLNNEIYLLLKNEVKNLKVLIRQEELRFTFFLKVLESENIAVIHRAEPDRISIATDYIVMNEPHRSLLNSVSFAKKFKGRHFIVEANFEIIVEPYFKPEILFNLALFTEPVTIQTISIFKITRESIYRSFAYGVSKEKLIKFLKKHSRHQIPDNVMNSIDHFISNLEINKLEEYKIIQANSQESYMIKENFKNKVIEIEPHTFLVFEDEVMEKIINYCKNQQINLKFIDDFLNSENYFYKLHESNLIHNIRHLHTMKEFFDFYGNSLEGTKVKIDNEI